MIKPILFNTEMVRAIQSGTKTVTRRLVKPQPEKNQYTGRYRWKCFSDIIGENELKHKLAHWLPPYCPGDVLWVRETFFREECTQNCAGQLDPNECPFNRVWDSCYGYKTQYIDSTGKIKWHPSIHMPKEAARLFLQVKDVRVERLQGITEGQAHAEGCCTYEDKIGDGKFVDISEFDLTARDAFAALWDTTIKPADLLLRGWDANPWVWVVEFERCEKPAGWPGEAGEGGG